MLNHLASRLIVIMALLGMMSNLAAQEATPQAPPTRLHLVTGYDAPELESLYRSYMLPIQENFARYHIEIYQDNTPPDIFALFMLKDVTTDKFRNFSISVSSPQYWLSPILYAHYSEAPYGSALTFTMDTHPLDSRAIMADLITGLALYAINRCDLAKEHLRQVKEYADVPALLVETASFYLGNCALATGEFETAIQHFETAIALSYSVRLSTAQAPYSIHNISPYINIAWAYTQLGQREQMVNIIDTLHKNISEVEKTHSTDLTQFRLAVRAKYAQLLTLFFDYKTAGAEVAEAIALVIRTDLVNTYPTQNLAELYVILGETILLRYEWDRALNTFNTAIELAPDYADAYFYRGLTHYTLVNREAALADFEHYLELAPEGIRAAEAQQSVESIRIELEALNGADN